MCVLFACVGVPFVSSVHKDLQKAGHPESKHVVVFSTPHLTSPHLTSPHLTLLSSPATAASAPAHCHCQMALLHQSDSRLSCCWTHSPSVLWICTIMTKQNHTSGNVILCMALAQQHNKISQVSVYDGDLTPPFRPHKVRWEKLCTLLSPCILT